MNNRISYLDNLKVALILLVIFDHVGLPYIGYSGFPYTPSNPNEQLPNVWRFMVINSSFFMSLFFFISGYFLPNTYDRQGTKVFVQKKFTRLGIPVLICGPIISAVIGRFYLGHLWYIENLLIFCLLYALYRKFFKPIILSKRININLFTTLLLSLFIGAGSHYLRHRYDQDYWAYALGFIQFEPVHYFQQVSMFVIGLLAGRNHGMLEKISSRMGGGIFNSCNISCRRIRNTR